MMKNKELKATDPAGTEGVYGGRTAMRVDLDGKPYVIATRNEGARSQTGYGKHYTWYEALSKFTDGTSAGKEDYSAPDVWRLPTRSELKSLLELPNTWTTQSGVNGRSFTVAEGKTVFLPAAGCVSPDDGSLYYQGEDGGYWSSTPRGSDFAYGLYFSSGDCNVYGGYRFSGYGVRLFCELPSGKDALPSLEDVRETVDVLENAQDRYRTACAALMRDRGVKEVKLDGTHGYCGCTVLQDYAGWPGDITGIRLDDREGPLLKVETTTDVPELKDDDGFHDIETVCSVNWVNLYGILLLTLEGTD